MVYFKKWSGNKYRAKSTIYNDKTYHSKFEAGYAESLDWMLKNKEIKGWERQVKLELKVNGFHITNYYIDFIITHLDGTKEFVECKGYETNEWLTKWRLLEATFEDFKQSPDDFMTMVKQSSWRPPIKRDKNKS